MKEYMDMLLKRRSIRKYDSNLHITDDEMKVIEEKIHDLKPLIPDIQFTYKIVKGKDTNCNWNGEYCILVYSEEKEDYLINIGYMFEQLDLYLESKNIGVCWYGFGKTDEMHIGNMKFTIMLCFGKCNPGDIDKDLSKTKRKEIKDFWNGDNYLEIANIVRHAPSACNSQPWKINIKENKIEIYKIKNIISPFAKGLSTYFNYIDMGIFLCYMDVVLENKEYIFERNLNKKNKEEHICTYVIK